MNKHKSLGSKHCINPKGFIDYSNDMDDIYEEYNPFKKRKI